MKFHTLLIGIDRYPLGYRSLYGCVNDIDALEELLLGAPGMGLPATTIDRLIAIGTTRADADLKSLALDKTVQEVVEEDMKRDRGARPVGAKSTTGPVELWTATVTPFHLPRQGGSG